MCELKILAIGMLSVFLSSACASSSQDLIEEAWVTGDWSSVNDRIEAEERLEALRPKSCPRGTRRWCTRRNNDEKCRCLSNSEFRDRLESLGL